MGPQPGPGPVDKLKNQEIDVEVENNCDNDNHCDSDCDTVTMLEEKLSKKQYQDDRAILKLLPDYEQLIIETDKYFQNILDDLVHAVTTKDIYYGLSRSTAQLTWYIETFGRRFSKEEHVRLVQLFNGLLTMEGCPERIIPTLCDMIVILLKKQRLLTSKDLIIPWRPLYKIYYLHSQKLSYGSISLVPTVDKLRNAIGCCNKYFEKNAFEEIVEEVSPLLFPANNRIKLGLQLFNYFLPFNDRELLPEWSKLMEKLFSTWDIWSSNCQYWQDCMLALMKTISIYYRDFDWSPYITVLFSRFSRILVSYRYKSVTEQDTFLDQMLFWIIGVLGNNKLALQHFRNFLMYFSRSTLEDFPSFFPKLTLTLTDRVLHERYVSKEKRIHGTHLTDEDVEFVTKIIFEICTDYYVDSCTDSKILRDLAYLNPKLVIPVILEKYYLSIDQVEEPGRFIVALDWIEQIMTAYITWEENYSNEAKWSGVVKLVNSLLPAIGPNDLSITGMALGIFRVMFQRIPMIDCSDLAKSTPGIESHWKKFCLQTKDFENLCSKFLDKVFELIEVSQYENISVIDNPDHIPKFDSEDDDLCTKLWNTFHPLAANASDKICTMLSQKIVDFGFTHILETHYSGVQFAAVYEAFVTARPDIILPMVLPRLVNSLTKLISEESGEELSPELDFLLMVLPKTFLCSGQVLLRYQDSLNELIPLILTLEMKDVQSRLCSTVTKLLYTLCSVYPLDVGILPKNKNGHLPHPKEWLTKYNINSDTIEVDWHVPTASELSWANELFLKVFTKYSDFIREQIRLMEHNHHKVSPLERQKLLNAISKLNASFEGISCSLCKDSSPPPGKVLSKPSHLYRYHEWTEPIGQRGEVFRRHYFDLLCSLLESMNKYRSDDTEALEMIVECFMSLNDHSRDISLFRSERSSYTGYISRDSPLDPLCKAFRPYFVIRASHMFRNIVRIKTERGFMLTPFSDDISGKLLELANNRYSYVRVKAQISLRYFVEQFSNIAIGSTATKMFGRIHADTPEHEVKGSLYTILELKQRLIHENTWENIYNLWTTVLNAPLSEKESVKEVQDDIINEISFYFLWFPSEQDIKIPASVSDEGDSLSKTISEIREKQSEIQQSSNNKFWYDRLSVKLLEIASSNSWYVKYRVCMILTKLIKKGMPMTVPMIQFFYDTALDVNLDLRTEAMNTLKTLSILFKRVIPVSKTVNTNDFVKEKSFESFYDFYMYKTENSTSNKVDRTGSYIHSPYVGFHSLPKELNFKSETEDFSLEEQPIQVQAFGRQSVLNFSNPAFVQEFLEIHTSDSIESLQETMRTYFGAFTLSNGPESLKVLMDEISNLLELGSEDLDKEKLLLVINILVGILRGMKYWSHENVSSFWEESLKPVLVKCWEDLTEETELCWAVIGSAVMRNRDPFKYRFFIEFLYEKCCDSIHDSSVTSVKPSIDITAFYGAIYALFWRGILFHDELYETFFEFVFKHPSPFDNVRSAIASTLGCMKNAQEFTRSNGEALATMLDSRIKNIPEMHDLMSSLTQKFVGLYTDSTSTSLTEMSKETRELLLSFKTVLLWLQSMYEFKHPAIFQFLPLLCQFVNFNQDVQIEETCDSILSALGYIEISSKSVDTILANCCEISKMDSWRSRYALANYLGTIVTCNMHIVKDDRYTDAFLALILELAYDTNIDVRGLATGYLCYFVRFSILRNPMGLFEKFKNEVLRFRKETNDRLVPVRNSKDRTSSWHAAISGLTAFVYANEGKETMPEYLPGLLIFLTDQLMDDSPEQVRAEVRSALRYFREQYQDNWIEHKNKFTEEQIHILNNAVVNSSYHV